MPWPTRGPLYCPPHLPLPDVRRRLAAACHPGPPCSLHIASHRILPGSACSVVIGEGLPLGEPGSVKGVQLVVEDLDAVRSELAARGVAISDVQQMGPEGTPGSRYCFFQDPDGNMWAVQEYKRS